MNESRISTADRIRGQAGSERGRRVHVRARQKARSPNSPVMRDVPHFRNNNRHAQKESSAKEQAKILASG